MPPVPSSPSPESNSPLDALKQRLYAQKPITNVGEETLRARPAQAQAGGWAPPPPPPPPKPKKAGGMPFAVKFLIGAGGFFVLAGLVTIGLIVFGGRSISTDHVDVTVDGPTTIASGDTVSLLVTVHNNNPIQILGATVNMDLPDGTRAPDDKTTPFENYSDTLGDIDSGAQQTRTVQAVIFGAEKQQLTIPVRVEYRTEGSNAVSVKEATYTVTVTTSPISLNVTTVGEAASGQPLTVVVDVRSNATAPIDSVAVAGDYPPGFVPTSSNPAPVSGTYFTLGTLAPGEEKKITITGMLTGQETEQRVFHFTAGTAGADGLAALGVPYTSNQVTVVISKPLLGVTLSINHQNGDVIVIPAGQPVSGLLTWQNSLADVVSGAQVSVKVTGNGLNPSSIATQGGFYSSSDSTIVYSKDTNQGLAMLQPGDSGTGAFALSPKTAAALASTPNPTITLAITVSGKRSSTGATVSSTITKTLQIATSVTATASASTANMPFPNTGPSSPTADTEKTYAINWTAANTITSVGAATMSTVLPAYVRFTGVTSAGDTSITYDDSTRTVTWNIGDLNASQAKQASFQVALLPSSSQKGTSPILIPVSTFSGTDRFTKAAVTATASVVQSGTVK